MIQHMGERIVPSGLSRGAHHEIEIAWKLDFNHSEESRRRQHRRQATLLLTSPAAPDAFAFQLVRGAIDDFARIRILHAAGGGVHGVANEH